MRKRGFLFLLLVLISISAFSVTSQCPQAVQCVPYQKNGVFCYMVGNDGNWGFSTYNTSLSLGTYQFYNAESYNQNQAYCYYSKPGVPLVYLDNQVPVVPGSGPWLYNLDLSVSYCGHYPNDYSLCQFILQ